MQLSFTGIYAAKSDCSTELLEQHIVKLIHHMTGLESEIPHVLETRVHAQRASATPDADTHVEIEITVSDDSMENAVSRADRHIKEAINAVAERSGGQTCLQRISTECEVVSR